MILARKLGGAYKKSTIKETLKLFNLILWFFFLNNLKKESNVQMGFTPNPNGGFISQG